MSFYGEWLRAKDDAAIEQDYLQCFLDYSPKSIEVLHYGKESETVEAVQVLLSIPIQRFVEAINHSYPFESKDVFQFSSIYDATDRLCNVLEYEEDALSYEEAGRILTKAPQAYACIKYGENHAKTAAMLSLVIIERVPNRKCNMTRISSLGSVYTQLSPDEKQELLRRLAIRNPFIKTIIFDAKNGSASYVELVSAVLSGQTIIRRKHNNEIIMDLILGEDPLNDRIGWQ